MLSSLHSFDDLNLNAATEISYYTQVYHGLAAYEITEVIIDFITSVSARSNRSCAVGRPLEAVHLLNLFE